MSSEREARAVPGYAALAGLIVVVVVGVAVVALGGSAAFSILGVAISVGGVVALGGVTVVQPNESKVLILFGRYTGTLREPGLWWVNPFTAPWRETISLRVRNFQSARAKVNDAAGNPIEIAAVIVWRVVDTARAVFDVEDFHEFVVVQSESAVRHVAQQYPYDDWEQDTTSLRGNADLVSGTLHDELQARLDQAGIEVLEARLTHLAYAAEIAEAMLRRQQASAIVAARRTIVEGAVGLVEMALERLTTEGGVALDEERRAAMAANLMVVLCSDRPVTPVINAGTANR